MEKNKFNEEQGLTVDSTREVKEEEKKSFFQILLGYLKGIVFDFIQSFKYNNMKLAGLLIMIPGAIFGFFLYFHSQVVTTMQFTATNGNNYLGTPDISGLLLFILMLFGMLNIFTGFTLMNKKNLGSLILVLITSGIMVLCGILYIIILRNYFDGVNKYFDQLQVNVAEIQETTGLSETDSTALARSLAIDQTSCYYIYGIPMKTRTEFNSNFVYSVGAVILCIVCAVAGAILGFINYDRTYEKADR